MKYIKSYKTFESFDTKENLYIHIDGSYYPNRPNNIYISAYMTTEDDNNEYFLSKLYNTTYINKIFDIKIDKTNSQLAENVSLHEILNILTKVENKNIIIYTDYLTNFNIINIKSKFHREMKKISSVLIDLFNKVKEKNNIEIRWIKGHSQVYGNMIANNLAQRKASFDTISTYLLDIKEKRRKYQNLRIPQLNIYKKI